MFVLGHFSLIFCQDGRFIAKELSKAELQTMETFAPAYFDFMSSAVSGHVSFNLQLIAVVLFTIICFPAPHSTRQSVWLLQVDFQEDRER